MRSDYARCRPDRQRVGQNPDRAVLGSSFDVRADTVVVASGVLSNELPWLAVSGRAIVIADSAQPIALRGINRSGLEYSVPVSNGFLEAAAISQSEIDHIVRVWGANLLRIPFNQDWALNGRGSFSAQAYLEALDRTVFWASRAGAYTLLDLHWLDADVTRGANSDGSWNRVPALPDGGSIEVWEVLARRYRNEPAVLFDIFNEPHTPIRGDTARYKTIDDEGRLEPFTRRSVTMREWQPWARQLVLAIRKWHPRSLIFVPGVRWAYDLRGMPLSIADGSTEVFHNVVYTTHVYPWCGPPRARNRRRWFAAEYPLTWREAFGSLARRAPVFIGEWGGGSEHVEWGDALARYARRLGLGWAAWSWSDWPPLVRNAQLQDYGETDFGRLVRRHLTSGATRTLAQRSANVSSPNF